MNTINIKFNFTLGILFLYTLNACSKHELSSPNLTKTSFDNSPYFLNKINKSGQKTNSNTLENEKKPLFSPLSLETLKINIIGAFITKRGIAFNDCNWWFLSDFFLKDKTGLDLFKKFKNKVSNTKIATIYVVGKKTYMIKNKLYLKELLYNSPNYFGPGIDKKLFFKSFMEKNVGISIGKEWYKRRKLNEKVLNINKRPFFIQEYNTFIKKELQKQLPRNSNDFNAIGKNIVSKVVFNDPYGYPNEIYDIFGEANSVRSLFDKNFKLNDKTMKIYVQYLNHHIEHPKEKSLVKLCLNKIDYCPINKRYCKNEVLNQIPHWMFPALGALDQVTPRVIIFLLNHPKIMAKVKKEILSMKKGNAEDIYNLKYLRNCILECIRLNPMSVAMFRTLYKNFEFSDGLKFKKGDNFLIFFSPILRDEKEFKNPNKFIPERWEKNPQLEDSYYSIMFSQGPQKCPGKELAIFLIKSFVVNYLKISNFKLCTPIKLNKNNITQMINPCSIKIN